MICKHCEAPISWAYGWVADRLCTGAQHEPCAPGLTAAQTLAAVVALVAAHAEERHKIAEEGAPEDWSHYKMEAKVLDDLVRDLQRGRHLLHVPEAS